MHSFTKLRRSFLISYKRTIQQFYSKQNFIEIMYDSLLYESITTYDITSVNNAIRIL